MTNDDFARRTTTGGLADDLTHLLNHFCAENVSNTPDFILARFMLDTLKVFNDVVIRRDAWYGINPHPGWPTNPDFESDTP